MYTKIITILVALFAILSNAHAEGLLATRDQRNSTHELICLGLVSGAECIKIRGYNSTLSTSIETISIGASAFNPLAAGASFEIVSGSANDDEATGNNAKTVYVRGVCGASLAASTDCSETADTDGQTAVDLVNTYLAINFARVASAGSGLVNAGQIDVQVDGGGQIHASIGSSTDLTGEAYVGQFTTAADQKLILMDGQISVTKNTDGANVFILDYDLSLTDTVARSLWRESIEVGAPPAVLKGPLVVDEQHRIDFRAYVDGGTTGQATMLMNAILVDTTKFDETKLRALLD